MYQKSRSYDVQFLRYGVSYILDHFLPFHPSPPPPNNLENQNQKPHRVVIILHMCTKNHNNVCSVVYPEPFRCQYTIWAPKLGAQIKGELMQNNISHLTISSTQMHLHILRHLSKTL